MVVKARFDGRAFVPDEPVKIPVGLVVEISLDPMPGVQPTPLETLMDRMDALVVEGDWPEDSASRVDQMLYGAPEAP